MKRASLRRQARAHTLGLDLRGEFAGFLDACPDLQPDDANQPSALERPEPAQPESEAPQRHRFQPAGNLVHDGALDAAEEPDGQVQVCGRSPAKLGGSRRARREVRRQLPALIIGQWQPEERADFQRRAGFFQLVTTQLLGAVGRQPK